MNKFIMDDYDELSPMMKAAKRWILWKRITQFDKEGNPKKDKKVPYYANGTPRNGNLDASHDIANFATFEGALRVLSGGKYEGLGFALGKDETGNYWQGVDFDGLSEHPLLGDMAEDLQGYVEHSPSGDGVHAIGYGRRFNALGSNGTGIEAYCEGRYFTVTGRCSSLGEPICLADYVERVLKPLHTITSINGEKCTYEEVKPEVINNLRLALFFMKSDDRKLWIDMGHALKTIGDNGRALWLAWSATSDAFDPLNDAKTWDSFKPERTGYAAVFAEAMRQGWINPNKKYVSIEYPAWEKPTYKIIKNKVNDLLSFIPDDHLLKRMAIQVAHETHLPKNSVFLIGLGVFSSMANRVYCTTYKNGTRLPIGLYTIGEQPPSASKSWCINIFSKPFHDMNDKKVHSALSNGKPPALFITNTTSEGLEKSLTATNGFFSAVSSEQGIFDSLLGLSYTGSDKANNNDVLLSGFDGGYVNGQRVTRECYSGRICGGVVLFAQEGSIEKVLKASCGTGISERFLMLSEGHNLGTRDHTKESHYDHELYSYYHDCCGFYQSALDEPKRLDDLLLLKINDSGFKLINEYRNSIEPHLIDGGKFSHSFLRGSAGKINMQIMKIAANLHVFNNSGDIIEDSIILSAIGIADWLLNNMFKMCEMKEVFGYSSEFVAIISYLEKAGKGKTEREIINSLRNTKPFKEMSGDRIKAIKSAINRMADNGKLKVLHDATGRILFSVG